MKQKNKITIILIRAEWCGHCKNFEPIYKKAEEIYKNAQNGSKTKKTNGEETNREEIIEFLKEYDIKFENYDHSDESVKNIYMINHGENKNQIEGYPTIFVKIEKNGINEYKTINHTFDDSTQKKDAETRFLENIMNVIKTQKSDNKILYIQQGGNNDEIYKIKYQKYKSKYLKLKNM